MNQVSTQELTHWLDTTLQAWRFKDYCPNGLQVEGKGAITYIITGVTASQALIELAVAKKADAVLVHHGWFWKNEDPCIRGPKRARLALALRHELNLWAYHLPLDAHPVLGNNAQLGRVLGFEPERDESGQPLTCGPDGLVWLGRPTRAKTLGALGNEIYEALQRQPLVVGNPQQNIERVAWCTGGAQSMIEAATAAGAQAYVTGEASEQTFHWAQETGTGFIAAGHHATERYGIQALGQAVAAQFGIRVEFIDLDNPI
ncbi:Nif3-like dinuclear metal center hexameric protein [Paralcaligenes sp. KSB-10]|uniref:Nif3-like dinuclear metal center hexameric protein n=1 Tax=Paralcaligenes sp. KSB-10 TaxID=2901142 RepID=UPI001E5A98A7|nr:Nif3-like dinuclear metal center hexameric protein [Paralcaligenes sp. KSB-10]UHL63307.1 Nif3-like dinuclear metal center hexameric protein [Paralcaligenes sp. KSB-10]